MTERKTVVTSPYVIGTAPFRPGDEADFGGKFIEQPNDLNRPVNMPRDSLEFSTIMAKQKVNGYPIYRWSS